MVSSSIIQRIQEYVFHFSDIPDLQFEAVPYPLDSNNGASYLLLVASINQNTSAENVRNLAKDLYNELGDDFLTIYKVPESKYSFIVEKYQNSNWRIKNKIPSILSSASQFINRENFTGSFINFGKKYPHAEFAADKLGSGISNMGKLATGSRKKVWMFLRWMVREKPDIGVWNPYINQADLRVPLDTNTGRAFLDLQKLPEITDYIKAERIQLYLDQNGDLKSISRNVESITRIARLFFPADPARVDYPFFCYGMEEDIREAVIHIVVGMLLNVLRVL